jgi:hypothetical protein
MGLLAMEPPADEDLRKIIHERLWPTKNVGRGCSIPLVPPLHTLLNSDGSGAQFRWYRTIGYCSITMVLDNFFDQCGFHGFLLG